MRLSKPAAWHRAKQVRTVSSVATTRVEDMLHSPLEMSTACSGVTFEAQSLPQSAAQTTPQRFAGKLAELRPRCLGYLGGTDWRAQTG